MAETPTESVRTQAAIVASRVSSARADVARYRQYDPPGTLDASHNGIIVWLADENDRLRTRLAEAERELNELRLSHGDWYRLLRDAVAAEREQCASLLETAADRKEPTSGASWFSPAAVNAVRYMATAIRCRANSTPPGPNL